MLDSATLGIGMAIIGLVVWAVRLEAKANRASDDNQLLRLRLENHEQNREIHHNADAFSEFEKRIDLRFAHLSETVEKVEKYVEELDRKFDRVINRED